MKTCIDPNKRSIKITKSPHPPENTGKANKAGSLSIPPYLVALSSAFCYDAFRFWSFIL